MAERLRASLVSGLDALGLSYGDGHVEALLAFIRLLKKWNKVYNLTAIRDLEKMIGLHLLDSLAVLPYLHGARILDVGTGAGLPGIPLALFSPGRAFCLLDSSGKKIRFVQQAVLELGLRNVEVVHARVEDFQPVQGFNTIITRAFASVKEILAAAGHLLGEKEMILAMKGRYPEEELKSLSAFDAAVIPLKVPRVEADRHVVRISHRQQEQFGESLSHG